MPLAVVNSDAPGKRATKVAASDDGGKENICDSRERFFIDSRSRLPQDNSLNEILDFGEISDNSKNKLVSDDAPPRAILDSRESPDIGSNKLDNIDNSQEMITGLGDNSCEMVPGNAKPND